MFKLQWTRIQNTKFAVYLSDTPVTLKKSQGDQPLNDNVDLKQGSNHTVLKILLFNGVWKKPIIKVFFF